ncbi:outer membrane protein assembly factor BamB family protein [Gaopeijia maritima]|uniref:outer membrane protein assembly factor BamB family protein n=1 Tax=Gaopeijia maritima TaxID=3119007 RepID=UPI003278F5CE
MIRSPFANRSLTGVALAALVAVLQACGPEGEMGGGSAAAPATASGGEGGGAMASEAYAGGSRTGTENGEWRYWGGDEGSSRYTPADQLDADNAMDLEVAWEWHAANYGPQVDYVYRGTPIKVGDRLYNVAGSRRAVVSIDAATGETLWMWRMRDNPRWAASTRQNYGKGVAYTEVDGRGRIFVITPGYYMAALDADTGRPIESFGEDGIVDLHRGLGDYPFDPEMGIYESGDITSSSPPIVVGDIIVVGNSHDRGYYPEKKENVPGHIRGYDVRTGEQEWIFHVLPQPGEFGHDTWENDAWTYTGNISAWAPLSADSDLGLVYIPTDPPTNDYYGGFRPGGNLFSTSLIALNAETGERAWHFQMVHHDIWNMDNPDAPHLVDITVDGEEIPAIAAVTKQGFTYVFNRATGEPVWPIPEVEVPQSDVPGEQTSPTQPHPTKPAPFEMQGMTVDNLIDFTPELRAQAIEIASQYRMGPVFTPPSLWEAEDGTNGAFVVPGANGGANIPGGAAVDPETGILYVASQRGHSVISLIPGDQRSEVIGGDDSNMDYVSRGPGGIRGPQGLPILKPPYGAITAIDLNTGEHLWRIPNGGTPESITNHPALQGVDLPVTGKNAHANILVTKNLLFYGEGRGGDPLLHVVDKATGEELYTIDLPAPTNTAPMSYMHEGRQYIVLSVGGAGVPARLVALALPEGY